MPIVPLQFGNAQRSGLSELAGASPVAVNVILDKVGAVHRRPGLSSVVTGTVDSDGIIGVYGTVNGQLYAVGGGNQRKLYRFSAGGANLLSASFLEELQGTQRPTFAETELLLTIAGGEEAQKIELSSDVSSRLANHPVESSHIAAIASRLVVNDVSASVNTMRYSGVANGNTSFAGHEQWAIGVGTAGAFSAEARPDPVLAVWENSNELFAFGRSTLQVFAPDPSLIWATVVTRERGCEAAYSIIKLDQVFAYLATPRRFIISDGRSEEVISDDIQKTLDQMTTVSDCFGYRVRLGEADCLVWTFPTDGRTFAYQVGSGWSQWQGWSGSNWSAFAVNAAHTAVDRTIYAGTTDGKIGKFDLGTATDFGTAIVARVTTGYEHHGTDARKLCKAVRLVLKRGHTSSSTEPMGWLRWRDRPGAWQGQVPIAFGLSSDTEPVLTFRSLGTYRARQWEVEFSGTDEFILARATEEFEILGV